MLSWMKFLTGGARSNAASVGRETRRDPIAKRLRKDGFELNSISDWVNGATPSAAVPSLIAALNDTEEVNWLDAIVRALITPAARGVAEPHLIALYDRLDRTPETEMLRWSLGNAIYELKPESVATDILRISGDQANGMSRQMFVMALSRLKGQAMTPLLLDLLAQDDVRLHAISAVRRLRLSEAEPALLALLTGTSAPVRGAAKGALQAIRRPLPKNRARRPL